METDADGLRMGAYLVASGLESNTNTYTPEEIAERAVADVQAIDKKWAEIEGDAPPTSGQPPADSRPTRVYYADGSSVTFELGGPFAFPTSSPTGSPAVSAELVPPAPQTDDTPPGE
jgi:hypothetical protein